MWWKSRLRRPDTETFVEVTKQLAVGTGAEAGVIELAVGRVVIRVRGQIEAESLKRVLDAVEARG
ncbi:hypothetical protein [Nannocystis pusilla]|uniref:BON domain-containing protein n=1 Tax=Nannocystis pusilla TaxID=889268 RepID=A0ABS7TR86_9BACT|nr:hypothetical protein [Nannocystis pusilla]MBZ5710728.1 hypothetical protein [Nannocystis pusilla]